MASPSYTAAPFAKRALALIAIAAPPFRDGLRAAARALAYL
jgi:acyl-CoA hydrolase